ncbi:E3 ubiquitin-protein ligase RBBP6-like [Panonychus citri]|uniref:E3 ubiquitin-protein ligase RBBP6-like n=1 Tax=Panonychus citri TaxID=50023 RepID=UPI0023075E6A|nr:E3 ubiquitin-protein ligase RBBP6-like [Panonychus citri]
MSIHYKFKGDIKSERLPVDDVSISVGQFKKCIFADKKIDSSTTDLIITGEDLEEYDSDEKFIPRNTSVIVVRIPLTSVNKKRFNNETSTRSKSHKRGYDSIKEIIKSSNLSEATEEESIEAMFHHSTQEYDPTRYSKNYNVVGPLPPNYTCYRCNRPGHHIKQCPTYNKGIKRSSGIPKSFMVPVSAEQKGALLTGSGFAIPRIDLQVYSEKKVNKKAPVNQHQVENESKEKIPEQLKCSLCEDLLREAVFSPCCANSFCDECLRMELCQTSQCPSCLKTEIEPENIIPVLSLRLKVEKFISEKSQQQQPKPEKESICDDSINTTTDKTTAAAAIPSTTCSLADKVSKSSEVETKICEPENQRQSIPTLKSNKQNPNENQPPYPRNLPLFPDEPSPKRFAMSDNFAFSQSPYIYMQPPIFAPFNQLSFGQYFNSTQAAYYQSSTSDDNYDDDVNRFIQQLQSDSRVRSSPSRSKPQSRSFSRIRAHSRPKHRHHRY